MTRAFRWFLAWFAFAPCALLAALCIYLPVAYLVSSDPHKGDIMIGWFWITVWGLLPAIALATLAWDQRRNASRGIIVLWAVTASVVLASAIVMLGWAVEA